MAKTGTGGSKKFLTKSELISALSVREEDIEVPDFGWIKVRGLPVNEGLAAMQGAEGDEDYGRRMVRIMVAGVKEPELSQADASLLLDGQMGVVQVIVQKIMELSGIAVGDGSATEAFLVKTPLPNSSSSIPPKSSIDSPAS